MKTGELIKQLLEQDPDGECHVRVNGGAIWFAERKPSYWDGSVRYIERDENGYPIFFVIQDKGPDKVDLYATDLTEWLVDNDLDASTVKFNTYDRPGQDSSLVVDRIVVRYLLEDWFTSSKYHKGRLDGLLRRLDELGEGKEKLLASRDELHAVEKKITALKKEKREIIEEMVKIWRKSLLPRRSRE